MSRKLILMTLTDEEAGFLYGQLHRSSLERSRYRRRGTNTARTAAQKAAAAIEQSIRVKLRKVLARGAAQTIEILNASLI
jgi:hypothetical protein